jgi:mono/diheme cytochrome c family protein
MNLSLIVRPTVFIVAAVAIAACSSGGGTPASSAPAPASSAAQPSAMAAPAPSRTTAAITPAMIAQGDSIYHAASCRRCHGADAKGAQNGPSLMGPTFMHVNGSYDDYVRVVTNGMPADSIKDKSHQFPMRPRGGTPALTDDQVKAVAAYVYSLSHK